MPAHEIALEHCELSIFPDVPPHDDEESTVPRGISVRQNVADRTEHIVHAALQWLRAQGCPWRMDPTLCINVATYEYLDVLQ